MISGTKPDIVMITTPPNLHHEISLFALEQGCHLICEKPTAMNAREAFEMLAAARREPGRLHLIDHELRYDPARREIGRRIQEGWVGPVRQLSWTQRSGSMSSAQRPWSWWSSRAAGGGLLGAIGSHAVDLFRFWGGEFSSVWGLLQTQIPERTDPTSGSPREVETDDGFSAVMKMSGPPGIVAAGATARLDMNIASPGPWSMRIEVLGAEGRLLLDDAGILWGARGGSAGWEKIKCKEDLPKKDREAIPDSVWARAFLRYAKLIHHSLKSTGGEVPGASTFEDGWRNQVVLDGIRRSSEEGGWIDITPDTLLH
jgi:predicted dehydrogenase